MNRIPHHVQRARERAKRQPQTGWTARGYGAVRAAADAMRRRGVPDNLVALSFYRVGQWLNGRSLRRPKAARVYEYQCVNKPCRLYHSPLESTCGPGDARVATGRPVLCSECGRVLRLVHVLPIGGAR